jgi:hypothetical protein
MHRRKPKSQQQQQQQQEQQPQVPLNQRLRLKWQSTWDLQKEAQDLAQAAAAAAAEAAEQAALLAAEEEEEEQLPTGVSTAAARRSSYGEAGATLLQLQQPFDAWVHHLTAWAQDCPALIQLQLQDSIAVPAAYQLPESYWQAKAPPPAVVEPAGQPEDAADGACRNSPELEQSDRSSSAAAGEGCSSLQQEQQEQQQEEKDKEKNLKPLEKPVDFVGELAQAVAAVKGLVEMSAAAASCGLSAGVGAPDAVLEEGWKAVQEVEWELGAYEKHTKWVPKRAQNVSLQAVLQQLEVLQCEARM